MISCGDGYSKFPYAPLWMIVYFESVFLIQISLKDGRVQNN